jgi:flagellar motor protein MotB
VSDVGESPRRRRGSAQSSVFELNPWPPFVDAMTAVLAAFAVVMLVLSVSQRASVDKLHKQEAELAKLREDKARIERKLKALATTGLIEVNGSRVILQGEVLFDSGSAELRAEGQRYVEKIAPVLAELVAVETDQMVMVGGHTDAQAIRRSRYDNNLDLSAARATTVAKVLVAAGLPAASVIASGFGEHHPRGSNATNEGRRTNRRIEIGLVPKP